MKKTLILFNCCLLVVASCYDNTLTEDEQDLKEKFYLEFILQETNPMKFAFENKHKPHNSNDVKFYLYTKNNPNIPQELQIHNEDSVKNSYFNKTLQTKVIIHGFFASYTSTPNGLLRETYLAKGDYNIISVDWKVDASNLRIQRFTNLELVGQDVAKMLDFLNEKFELNFERLVIIGHNLGAHVAGFCGKFVKRDKLSNIVGLNPSHLWIDFDVLDERLSSSDAKYVEVIQTVGNISEAIGTITFYPNYAGEQQPGCHEMICSDLRSIRLYNEALKGYSFQPIYKCNDADILNDRSCTLLASEVQIGDPLEIKRSAGIYSFGTNNKAPYGYLSQKK